MSPVATIESAPAGATESAFQAAPVRAVANPKRTRLR